jgi:hypothetical protein
MKTPDPAGSNEYEAISIQMDGYDIDSQTRRILVDQVDVSICDESLSVRFDLSDVDRLG